MQKTDTALDEALAQSFPASDPLPMNPGPSLNQQRTLAIHRLCHLLMQHLRDRRYEPPSPFLTRLSIRYWP